VRTHDLSFPLVGNLSFSKGLSSSADPPEAERTSRNDRIRLENVFSVLPVLVILPFCGKEGLREISQKGTFPKRFRCKILFPELTVSQNDEFCTGKLFKPHRSSCVYLVCRNPYFRTEAELETVVKPGRCVYENSR